MLEEVVTKINSEGDCRERITLIEAKYTIVC